ncbi:hypothetical protein I3842_10G133700 [Carya illinoinensis]|uniref:Uncharacterized protein n=1 Tax=Carya illinoinensis TaxID=32201 RepID=A0A922DZU3_CARIL|nr:hypothetical protein I3842_10G133700 [Carya illinoinensis]
MGAPNLESFQITVWYSTLHAVPDFMGALFVSRGSGWPLKSSSYEGDTLLFLCYPSSVPCGMHCGLGARHLTSSKGLPIRLSNIPCNKDRFSSICTHKFLPLAYKYSVGSAESTDFSQHLNLVTSPDKLDIVGCAFKFSSPDSTSIFYCYRKLYELC